MKGKTKKQQHFPEIHLLGDLKDIKKLVRQINKKNSLVIFRNGETAELFSHVDDEIIQFAEEDVARLGRDYRLIYFDFFPDKKMVAQDPAEENNRMEQREEKPAPNDKIKDKHKDGKGKKKEKEKTKKRISRKK